MTERHVRLRRLLREADDRGHPDETVLSIYRDRGVIPKASRSDNYNKTPENLDAYKLVGSGNLVVNKMKAWQGSVAISRHRGIVSGDYMVCRVTSTDVDTGYLHHLLRSQPLIAQYRQASTGVRPSQWRLYWDGLADIRIRLPKLSEQRAIADYLDTETARIDALIGKKRHLVQVLEERERVELTVAVSGQSRSHERALTGSLWFPELPRGWNPVRVGFLTHRIVDGPHVSPSYVDEGGVPFISVRNIAIDGWNLESAKRISDEDFRRMSTRVRPEIGDVLLTKGGTTGIARAVDLSYDFQVWVHIAVLKVRLEMIRPEFLAASLNSNPGFAQSRLYTRGATNQDLALGRIAQIVVPLPPLDEQAAIVKRLETTMSRIFAAKQALERQIQLLQEHRQALITAAVAGDLEVPGVAA